MSWFGYFNATKTCTVHSFLKRLSVQVRIHYLGFTDCDGSTGHRVSLEYATWTKTAEHVTLRASPRAQGVSFRSETMR